MHMLTVRDGWYKLDQELFRSILEVPGQDTIKDCCFANGVTLLHTTQEGGEEPIIPSSGEVFGVNKRA